jgi:hypothetical protein
MMFLPLLPSASYGQWLRHGMTDNNDDNGDGATDNDGNGDGATDDDDDDGDDGDDSDGAAADYDDDVDGDVDNDDVNDIDDDNLPPLVGKRNDGCDKTKTKEEETVGDTHNNQTDHREGGGRWRRLRQRR